MNPESPRQVIGLGGECQCLGARQSFGLRYRQGQKYPEGSRLAGSPRPATLDTPENFAYLRKLTEFAANRGHSPLELEIAWLATQESVASTIAEATKRDQVLANVKAGGTWRLSVEDLRDVPPTT
jgi:aryl-alcohol dehydrogenase-like predicted oxidoreductase